ncbi:NUDIX domain-containing protein [Candidatus Dojkabacteria bacterium]|nr:NUDIX domain-containing protein [Candidatus Dojkabacteria bacterium]
MKPIDLHPFQMIVLKKLLFLPTARFRDLKIEGLTTDHLTYHINKLIKLGLVSKINTIYTLTPEGKEFSNRIDEHSSQIEVQGKRGVLVRVSRKIGRKTEYLASKRLKHPFYGYIGFHTGKIRAGETVYEAARRELLEETGLIVKTLKFGGIDHFVDFDKEGKFLRDQYFYWFDVTEFEGELIIDNPEEGVSNFWITKQALKKEKVFPGLWDRAYWENKKSIIFVEQKRVLTEF